MTTNLITLAIMLYKYNDHNFYGNVNASCGQCTSLLLGGGQWARTEPFAAATTLTVV